MATTKTLQQLFQRYRMPGDLIFAIALLVVALVLLVTLTGQTKWLPGKPLFAQPRFWPAIGVFGMVGFGALHLLGSVLSPRIPGRLREMLFWLRSLEYVAWFLVYVFAAPVIGYLPATLVFMVALTLRVGYRGSRYVLAAAGSALAIVLLFRVLLQVKIPGGAVYEYLPGGLASFMLTYL